MKIKRLAIEDSIVVRKPKVLSEGELKRFVMPFLIQNLEIRHQHGKFITNATKACEGLDKMGLDFLANLLAENLDVVTIQTAFLHQEWKHRGMKNYFPSKPLIDVLANIEVSMPADQFVDGSTGYVELAHTGFRVPKKFVGWDGKEDRLNYILFKVVQDGDRRVLIFSCNLVDSSSFSSFCVELQSGRDIYDIFRDRDFKNTFINEKNEIVTVDLKFDESDLELLRLCVNIIIYISNPNEEFKKHLNDIPKGSKQKQEFLKEHTSLPVIPIGFDVEFLRLVTTETFDVRGHWRWQPVGPERKFRKMTFIKPHTRSQKVISTQEAQ